MALSPAHHVTKRYKLRRLSTLGYDNCTLHSKAPMLVTRSDWQI